ncbi:glycosyltransferase [Belnapia sp. T18]|uniref:Glycosyltransferase n=1 Tax=Belnapia arida TaxID=2804533 RepID=A0ABS1U8V2_9PROT|nr:glycosyltransferase [Belnapia arida]MBL6080364.1 glycosyltransferase [Belnapia arida]
MAQVCAVVLTYNRKELLGRCLAALAAQTRPCDRIIVLDNASTDGTPAMLETAWLGQVEAHVLERNIGAAGGFNLMMRLGYQTGADYVWVMDDDVLPEPDALERLLAAAALLAERQVTPAFLSSVVRAPDGQAMNVPEVDRRRNALAYENWPDLLEHRLLPVIRTALVSDLVPRETLERHGLPIAGMFIWGEDTEFTLRVTRDRPGFIVGDSCALHLRRIAGALDIHTERDPVRIAYHFYRIRNDVFLRRRFEGRRAMLRLLRQQGLEALDLAIAGEFAKAGIILRGLLAGLRFDPAIEAADSPFTAAPLRRLHGAAG